MTKLPSFFFNSGVAFLLFLFLASLSFWLFGQNPVLFTGDAEHYNAYARNLVLGKGYSLDGETFSIYREPVYPFVLSFIYRLFGLENILAVNLIQVVLVAAVALFVFKSLALFGCSREGVGAGLATAFLPAYAYYANLPQIEILFTFWLSLSFWLTLFILKNRPVSFWPYVFLGIALALMGLSRSHMIFFLLAAVGLLAWHRHAKRQLFSLSLVFVILTGVWAGYVYRQTGVFAVTSGRQDLHLYSRAVRAELSYGDNVRYLSSWIKRSLSGGQEDQILEKYDLGILVKEYGTRVGRGDSIATLKKESLAKILAHPGRYLFGNALEFIKLMFVEHLFPPVSSLLSRLVRAAMYLMVYLLLAGGVLAFVFFKTHPLSVVFKTAAVFILYHWLVLSFVDAVPRFNTPYLFLYLLVGAAGLAGLKHGRASG